MLKHPIATILVPMALLSVAVVPTAHAQLAVIDPAAIVQLVQEVETLAQQVETARDQLLQARQALQTMTGDRGMALLLAGTARNYLPSNWSQLTGAMQGTGGSSALASDVQSAIGANAILTPQQLAVLSVASRQRILAGRQSSALQQALAKESLANASGRFASIQSLIDAIPGAADQKAILDLQARINAELGMLQNEQTKLRILEQATHAQQAVNEQQQREQTVAAHGRFESRFQPVP